MRKSESKNKSLVKQEIIEKYTANVIDYFTLMNKTDLINELNNPVSSMYIGINAIHRVFEFILLKTKSIEKANYYSKKTYYYYLEYMEQIYRSNLSQNLNHKDAILFVYKKTIFDFYEVQSEENQSFNTMNNIMTLTDDNITIDDKECQNLFLKISKIINTLFFWENTLFDFNDRVELCNQYLYHFLIHIENMDLTVSYLEFIQQKMHVPFSIYKNLLNEIIEKTDDKKRAHKILSKDTELNECFLIKFYVEEPVFREKFESGNMKEFVRWLYAPI